MPRKRRNINKLEIIVILQVSIEVVLIAFAILFFVIAFFKIPVLS